MIKLERTKLKLILCQKNRNYKTEIVTQMTKPDRTKPKSSKETFVISISNRVGR